MERDSRSDTLRPATVPFAVNIRYFKKIDAYLALRMAAAPTVPKGLSAQKLLD